MTIPTFILSCYHKDHCSFVYITRNFLCIVLTNFPFVHESDKRWKANFWRKKICNSSWRNKWPISPLWIYLSSRTGCETLLFLQRSVFKILFELADAIRALIKPADNICVRLGVKSLFANVPLNGTNQQTLSFVHQEALSKRLLKNFHCWLVIMLFFLHLQLFNIQHQSVCCVQPKPCHDSFCADLTESKFIAKLALTLFMMLIYSFYFKFKYLIAGFMLFKSLIEALNFKKLTCCDGYL